jgi:hypothetical protein
MALRIRRGSNEQRLPLTFEAGELIWVNQANAPSTAYKLYVGHPGVPGGIDILQSSVGNKLRYNTTNGKIDLDLTTGNRLNTDDIIQLGGATNKFFTNELAQDAVGAMFTAGTMSGITFVYDDIGNKMNVTVTGGGGGGGSGITALYDDPAPQLGGTLNLSSQNITGVGSIDIDGYAIFTGTLAIPAGMDSDISMNGFDITGEGNILLGGNANFVGTLTSQTGLGADLSLNGNNLTGLGDIIVSGLLSVNGLGADLSLNGYDITGTGNIAIDGGATFNGGDLSVTGNISSGDGFSTELKLNDNDITGTSNISGSGKLSLTKISKQLDNFSTTDTDLELGGTTDAILMLKSLTSGSTGLGQATTTIRIKGQKGTFASPEILEVGDSLGQIIYNGFVNAASIGTTPADLAVIKATVDKLGDTSTAFATAKIEFWLSNGLNPVNAKSASFSSNGAFQAPIFKLTSYASDAARLAAVPTPEAGMMVFMTSGTSPAVTNKAVIYNGASWAVLPG